MYTAHLWLRAATGTRVTSKRGGATCHRCPYVWLAPSFPPAPYPLAAFDQLLWKACPLGCCMRPLMMNDNTT